MPQSVDNLGFETDGLNLFAYCHNRPLNVSEINIASAQNKTLQPDTEMSASQALAASVGIIGDFVNMSSGIASLLQGINVYKYLQNIHGNPPKISWFFNNLNDFSQLSKRFGYISATIGGVIELINSGSWSNAVIAGLSIFGASSIAQYIGMVIGGTLGGLPGLFVGTVIAFAMFYFVPKLERISDDNKSQKDFIDTFKHILSNRKLNLLNVIAMLKTLVTTSSCILLPFLWKDMGYNAFYIGFALFAFNFAGAVGSFVSRRFELKVGTKNVFYFSMMLTFPMMILFMLTYKTYPTLALVIFILMGLIQWMAVPVTMVMAQSVLPQYKSIIGGFINGFSWGVVAIVMTGIGFIAQAKGIIPVLLVVSAIPAFLSYPIVKKLFSL